jgi:hypothetical protein
LVALAGIGVFLTRQPFRLALTDLRKGKRYPRTQWAIRFAALFAGLGTLALLGGAMLASAPFYAPLLGAAAFGALQFSFDIRGEGRRFVPEVCGATAMAMFGVAIAQSGGLSGAKPWLIGLLLALQFGTAIPYAAARVRLARGVSVNRTLVYAGHLASLAAVGAMAAMRITGWPIAVAFALLSVRAVWGLSCHRREVRAATVGMQEVAYTILCVSAMVLSI